MKNKRLLKGTIIGIIFILLGVSILPSAYSKSIINQGLKPTLFIIQVDDDGDGDYTSIQDAIDNATAGDTIEVYSGNYHESINVDKQLIITGISNEFGDGNGTGKPHIFDNSKEDLIAITANYCKLSGFYVTAIRDSLNGIMIYSDGNEVFQNEIVDSNFGIHLWSASYNKVYDNYLWGMGANAAVLNDLYSNYNQIYNNQIKDSDRGIRFVNFGEFNSVYNNIIYHIYGSGISLNEAYNNSFFNNTVTDCWGGIGLHVEERNGNLIFRNNVSDIKYTGISVSGRGHKIYQNNVTNCEYGIKLHKIETIPPIPCSLNEVYENIVTNCEDAGIKLDGVYQSDILKNKITGNGIYGILMEKSEENKICENNITYNKKYGIHSYESEYNYIYHNNFINNQINAWCDGEPNNRFNFWNTDHHGGNYWSDYFGEDKNGDEVGDKPYIIPDMDKNPFNNNKDKYPLMEPDSRPNKRLNLINRDFVILEKLEEQIPIIQQILYVLNNLIKIFIINK